MKTHFKFKHLDHSDALTAYAENKLDEIGKFLLKDGECNVFFWKKHHQFFAEVTLNTKQKFFKAVAHSSDIYVAMDMVCDKLERQFIKVKEVYTDHKKAA